MMHTYQANDRLQASVASRHHRTAAGVSHRRATPWPPNHRAGGGA